MYGAHERHLLEQASHWQGLGTRRTEAYEPNGGSRSQSSQLGSIIDWQELLPQSLEEAQLLLRGTAGRRVQIPDWSVFLEIYDGAIKARQRRQRASA
ncbi:type IV secretory pathway, VirD4 component [Mycolicibacterium tokaiense]|uniref:Type IV secretory pathway, VirD4 component n=1 Tax=Mycolicibacterium tokaiense TaxID=39695 RepID=A0A379PJN6_9MYCO|nr:type IV secretory pathway, VirD4 component [Mycolicibacterium tokaiense]